MKLKNLLNEISMGGAAGAIAARRNRKRRQAQYDFNKKHKQGKDDWHSQKIKNPDTGKEIFVKTALSYPKTSPVYLAAIKLSKDYGLDHIYNAHFTPKGTLRQPGSRKKEEPIEQPKEEPKKQGFLAKFANIFGNKNK